MNENGRVLLARGRGFVVAHWRFLNQGMGRGGTYVFLRTTGTISIT
jgi:hypothetical protein